MWVLVQRIEEGIDFRLLILGELDLMGRKANGCPFFDDNPFVEKPVQGGGEGGGG